MNVGFYRVSEHASTKARGAAQHLDVVIGGCEAHFPVTHFLGLPRSLWLFLVVQSVAWILTPTFLNTAPELNTAEIGMWGREWFWVNYKHPALPSWFMALAYGQFGVHTWVPYVVSQVFIWATYACVFLLGRKLLGDARSLVGTLLLAGVTSFSIATLKFNHNIAQMPFWAAFCLGLWRASESNKLGWWSFTAAVAALGIYAKFSTAMLIAFGSGWIIFDPLTRSHLRTRAPYVALGLFALLLTPLAHELVKIDFLPFRWIAVESANKGISTSAFLLGQAVVFIGLPSLALLAGLLTQPRQERLAGLPREAHPLDRRRMAYLILLGVGPLALTVVMSIFARLRINWTMPMYNISGLLLVASLSRGVQSAERIRRVCALATALSLAVAAGYGVWNLYNRCNVTRPLLSAWPMAEISQRFDAIWMDRVGRPLRIVAGEHWTASLVGLPADSAPQLFTNMDIRLSPSMTPDRVARDGALVLWRTGGGWQPPPDMLSGHATGTETFQSSTAPNSKPIKIGYLIIPPQSPKAGSEMEQRLSSAAMVVPGMTPARGSFPDSLVSSNRTHIDRSLQ